MPQSPQQVVALSANRYWQQIESLRVMLAQRLWDWYYNDEDRIQQYILYGEVVDTSHNRDRETVSFATMGGLRKIFPKTYAEMTPKIFNIVQRVIDKLSFVYKEPPIRQLNGGAQTKTINGKVTSIPDKDDEIYQNILTRSTIQKKQTVWNSLGKLFNTVLVQPIWVKDENDDDRSYMDFLIHTPAWCVVETDERDWLKAKAFYYAIWLQLHPDSLPEQVIVYWNKNEYKLIDVNGADIPMTGTGNGTVANNDMVNPYKIIPAIPLRFKDGINYWGEGMWDLVNANQEICEQVTNLAYIAKTQAHGQLVILDPAKSVTGDIMTGVDHPIHIHSFEQGQSPDVKYINAHADIAPVRDLVDWYIKTAQMVKGLSPQQYSLESKIASGVSKMVDSTEIEEIRKADQHICTMFESDLFDVMRIVYNYHNPSKQISMDAKFSISFPEPQVNRETQADKNARMQFDLDNHLVSYIDLLREKYPELSDDDLMDKFKQIVAEMREMNDESGTNELVKNIMNQSNQQPNLENNQPNNLQNNLPNQPQPSAKTRNLKTAKG